MTRPRTGSGTAIVLAALLLGLTVRPAPVEAAGPTCATPGANGTATLSGVVNTYYPATLSAAAGTSSITLGPAVGASTPIAVGDLLLVIQMQDAAIDSTNTDAYGNGVGGDPATGSTALNSAGRYEYTVAASLVPLAGGVLAVGGTLTNTYNSAAATATQGRRTFQVIRVPQYVNATLTSALTALAWNGSAGGLLALDVQVDTNLNGATVNVSEQGFRAGLGRSLNGAGGGATGTDYVNLSTVNFHGQKGEGIAGTPRYLFDSRTGGTVDNGADGLPNGSTARGAPGTAGGGGTDPGPVNDENTGGGGGANGGQGGQGGDSWNSGLSRGGFGGTAFPATALRVVLGAGGGAGSRNNAGPANGSSGGNGGGIVMIRTGTVSGTGTITANGGTGVDPANDGGGGGGAGGSVVVVAQGGGFGGLTVNARGGAGANAWPTNAGGPGAYHGPGGGGGGGVVLSSSAPGTGNVSGGVNGTTTTDLAAYGATPGAAGLQSTIAAGSVPGTSSGAACSPDLTIAKSHVNPFVRGSTGSYSLTVSNGGGGPTSTGVTVTDTLPANLTPTAANGTGWTCVIAAQTVTCDRSDALAASGSYPAITITVSVAQSAAGSLNNTATVAGGGEVDTSNDSASDATTVVSSAEVAVTKVASGATPTVGSNVTFTITALNNGPSDASGVQVTDQLPAGLTFVSAAPSAGTYDSVTGIWNIGALSSSAAATLGITATVTATGAITNTATKSAEVESDPVGPNNAASASITGQPTAVVPGPPNGGMAAVSVPTDPLRGGLLLVAAISAFLGLLWLRRRSPEAALAGLVIGLGTLTALAAPVGAPLTTKPGATHPVAASIPVQEPDKPLTTVKPVIGTSALHPAQGAITPYRIRIPSLGIDTLVESVGVRRNGAMDVPGNIWNAAWLRSGPRPGATGQAVIDGHLDSTLGTAAFSDLHKLHPGDRIYVSDKNGGELTFSVSQLKVAPLDGFPALRVFGPAKGHFLNLITCAGRYDTTRQTYDQRLVVFTTLTV